MQDLDNPVTHPRRRALGLIAFSAGLAGGAFAAPAALPEPRRWVGRALGAPASIIAYDEHPQRAARALADVESEIEHLERVFSLHRADSEVVRLNAQGQLARPSAELLDLLHHALDVSEQTAGAFDPTVQPLWALHRAHFRARPAATEGPPARDIEAALRRVDYRAVDVRTHSVRFARPGLAITLNGIAQGFIVDRLVERLLEHGLHTAMLDAGEIRALGRHPAGRPWRAGIRNPSDLGRTFTEIELSDEAIATSAAYGTVFDLRGQHHHLFDPRSGRSTQRHASVSVICRDAATADALSTAFSNMGVADIQRVLARHAPARAIVRANDGSITRLAAASATG